MCVYIYLATPLYLDTPLKKPPLILEQTQIMETLQC